ncbi:MAG: hypothetical protein GY861_28300 [bacterium]|nr:hypothetical protein [bacterium]
MSNYESNTAEITPDDLAILLDVKTPGKLGSHFLDTDKTVLLHQKIVMSWWILERNRQRDNRNERMEQHEYYDGIQWTDEEKIILKDRGQQPYTYNRIKPSIDWMIGTERQTRIDYAVLPRKEEDSKAAENKTKLLKYVQDVNKARFIRSQVAKDQFISGLGWLDIGIRSDSEDEPLYIGYEDWRNVWHDSAAKTKDGSDGRFQFRSKIVDYDIALAMFPDRSDCLRANVNQSENWYSDQYDEMGLDPELDALYGDSIDAEYRRLRVRLVACEYRVPEKVKVIRGKSLGSIDGIIFDETNEGMQTLVNGGHASLYDAVKMVMYKMIFCGKYVLQWRKRVYNHNKFSLVPYWAYSDKKTGMPFGAVKQCMDPQNDLNKRFSKGMHYLSTKQTISEEGAIEDIDAFNEEKSRPDGDMVVADGKLDKIRLLDQWQLGREHISLMEMDAGFIESIAGVTDENRGVQTNAISGKAIQSRQMQGHTQTMELYDNMRMGEQIAGEIELSLIEQFYTEEKTIRLTGDRGTAEYATINDGQEMNDITATQADFIIESDTYHATVRQSMFEAIGAMIIELPEQLQIALADVWVDLSDIPQRKIAVERIRAITNQKDPNEDPNDPEVQARLEQEQQEMARQREIEDKMIALEMALKEADIALKEAQARETDAEAEREIATAREKIASIATKVKEVQIKKAEVMDKIETRQETNRPAGNPARLPGRS